MRKALRIISISAAIVSVVSAVVLGCIYLEDVLSRIKKVKTMIVGRINDQKFSDEVFDCE